MRERSFRPQRGGATPAHCIKTSIELAERFDQLIGEGHSACSHLRHDEVDIAEYLREFSDGHTAFRQRHSSCSGAFVSITGRELVHNGPRPCGAPRSVLEDDDVTKRFRSVDDRIDATRTHLDHLQLELSTQLDRARHDLVRLVVAGLLVSILVVTIMCLVTLAVLR